MHDLKLLCALSPAVVAAATFFAAPEVNACGGTFCDAAPQPMPVDQTGENIAFVMQDGWVEAHIQIQYDGDPERFAWIVPVMAEPEVTVGSDLMFRELLAATVPTFEVRRSSVNCGDDSQGGSFGCGDFDGAYLADGEFSGDSGGEQDGPEVVAQGQAGAFEYAVLDGGTVEGVTQWLLDNHYQVDGDAEPILRHYLDEGFLFLAFKLRSGAGVNEIHPVVVRYEGDEPCVPIRLTAIAAQEDMGIRAFFFGEHRVAPTNYRMLELNPLALDWADPTNSYLDLVSRAVDLPGANGRAFITEYAGSPDVVQAEFIFNFAWDSSSYLDIGPEQVVSVLMNQQLMFCGGGECLFAHPQVPPLLERHLPPPPDVRPDAFYECLSCYSEWIDEDAWSDEAFAADFEERIVAPARAARRLVTEHPYLTRLFTMISPHEMTADPVFAERRDLEPVSNLWTATLVNDCEGEDEDYYEFPDGQRLAVDPDGRVPESQPLALLIEEYPAEGAPMTLEDNLETADAAREDWNAAIGLGQDEGCNCRSTRRTWGSGIVWMLGIFGFAWIARRPRPTLE